jgi:hypothetical protein
MSILQKVCAVFLLATAALLIRPHVAAADCDTEQLIAQCWNLENNEYTSCSNGCGYDGGYVIGWHCNAGPDGCASDYGGTGCQCYGGCRSQNQSCDSDGDCCGSLRCLMNTCMQQ